MTMLHVLHRIIDPESIRVLTVDHQLQDDVARRSRFVEDTCKALVKCDGPRRRQCHQAGGLEAEARQERYRILSDYAELINASAAHCAHSQ